MPILACMRCDMHSIARVIFLLYERMVEIQFKQTMKIKKSSETNEVKDN